ncbi:DUF6773 family protein [Alteribacillus sp. JSM 102045]|uniref:DUF6773 family protein n=1 Tax=Alteribacillus sp. JSM 102045 TaxID=1562101 RepID=UPI0035C2012D
MIVNDERITQAKNQIYKEIHGFVLAMLLISVAIKFFLYGVNINLVATELIILMAQGLYYGIRSTSMGIFSAEVEIHDRNSKWPVRKKHVVIGLATGVILSLYMGIHSAVSYAEGTTQTIYYFGLVFLVSFMIYVPILAALMAVTYFIAKKRSKCAEEKNLNDGNS